jgi:iron complex outermembrane receptor protein
VSKLHAHRPGDHLSLRTSGVAVVGALSLALPALSNAQSAPAEEPILSEITVTAQRREELLQNVPIAVTAVTEDTLDKLGIADTSDLKALVPSLNFSTAIGGLGLPRIRGVGSTGQGPGVENPVATYIDGVYIGSSIGALTSLSDIQQVAVLKGPQGTLFGRNATGGLIQITTKIPSHEFTGDLQATAGNYGTYGGNAYLSGGLSQNTAASIAFKYENRQDGFGVNTVTGHEILDQESYSGRAKLLWDLGDSTTITLSGDISHLKSANPAFRSLSPNVLGHLAAGGSRDITADVDPALKVDQHGGSIEIRHHFDGVELMSLSAYRHMKFYTKFDPDDTIEAEWAFIPNANSFAGAGFAHGYVIENTELAEQFTQEFQLLSSIEGAFKWVAGAFYMNAEGSYEPAKTFTAALTAGNPAFFVPPGSYTSLSVKQTLDSYAAYAQGTYSFTSATNLTTGVRYTSDKREMSGIRNDVNPAGVPFPVQQPPKGIEEHYSDTFPRATWRLSLDHHLSETLMGYVSYNRGYRSAAYVVGNVGLNTPLSNKVLKPEIVDAYELGLKSDMFNRRVRLNAAAYYYDQENVQVMQIISGVQNIYNADGARIYGVDADLTALLTERLTLTSGINFTHARYTDFKNAVISTPQPVVGCPAGTNFGGNCLTIGDVSGKRLQNVPDWTANVGLSYEIPSAVGRFSIAANFYYNDGWAADADNRVRQKSYELLDGSVTWRSQNDTVSVSVWGKNLTDQFYFQQLGASNFGDNGVQSAPRTYGITFGLHF